MPQVCNQPTLCYAGTALHWYIKVQYINVVLLYCRAVHCAVQCTIKYSLQVWVWPVKQKCCLFQAIFGPRVRNCSNQPKLNLDVVLILYLIHVASQHDQYHQHKVPCATRKIDAQYILGLYGIWGTWKTGDFENFWRYANIGHVQQHLY